MVRAILVGPEFGIRKKRWADSGKAGTLRIDGR